MKPLPPPPPPLLPRFLPFITFYSCFKRTGATSCLKPRGACVENSVKEWFNFCWSVCSYAYVASALTCLSLCLRPSKNQCYEGIALHYVIFHHDFSMARNHNGISYAPVRGLFGIDLALCGLISVV